MRFANSVEYSSNIRRIFIVYYLCQFASDFFPKSKGMTLWFETIQNSELAICMRFIKFAFIVYHSCQFASGAVFFDEIKGRESHIVWQSTHSLTLVLRNRLASRLRTRIHTHFACPHHAHALEISSVSPLVCVKLRRGSFSHA